MQDKQYLTDCHIEITVWRSKRLNQLNDELVVARGTDKGISGHFMAWEIKENRPGESISWNGTVSWYPRMFWAEQDIKNSIQIIGHHEFLTERVPAQKTHNHIIGKTVIEHNGDYYVKLRPFTEQQDKITYIPILETDMPNSYSAAVKYVQWFNENNRQIVKYGKLCSQSKKAKKRRSRRLIQRNLQKFS